MKTLLLIGTMMLGALAVGGCSSPCDELQKKCNACKNQTEKDACTTAVNTYKAAPTGDTACQAALDAHTYDNCETQ